MGKPRIDLLKGIEEQENVIKHSKSYQKEEPQKQDAPQTTQKPQTASEPTQTEETPKKEKAEHKTKKMVMGFRADQDKVEKWKLYAEATGQEIGIMCTAAIDEYTNNHKMTTKQKQIFDIKVNALEAERRIKGL